MHANTTAQTHSEGLLCQLVPRQRSPSRELGAKTNSKFTSPNNSVQYAGHIDEHMVKAFATVILEGLRACRSRKPGAESRNTHKTPFLLIHQKVSI